MAILKFQAIKPRNSFKGQNHQGYSVNYIPELNSLLVFGVLSTCNVYLFCLSKKQWSIVKTSGKKPSFRRFYAHHYHKAMKGLIIHGGQIIQNQKKLKSSDQCYILFVSSWQWRKIFLQQGPSSRQYHQIISYQLSQNVSELLIFGGFSKPYETFLNDLWSLKNLQNISTKTNKHQVHGCESRLIQTKGQAPFIYGYSAVVINQNALFFGGQQKSQKKKLEIYVLSLDKYNWQKLEIVNKICPSLIFAGIYESAIENDKIHIMGGLIPNSNKPNDKCYSLSLKEMEVFQEPKTKLPQNIFNTCFITVSPLCIGSIQYNQDEQDMQINVMYEKQPNSAVSKHFETDQIQESKQQVSIQEYLKAIKHEQTLSQEILKKNLILEELYKQIQRYISTLYLKYLNDDQTNQQIQREKVKNISSCQELKQGYIQNAVQFQEAIKMIKKLRGQLGQIHEDFERCIQTQIDEEQN